MRPLSYPWLSVNVATPERRALILPVGRISRFARLRYDTRGRFVLCAVKARSDVKTKWHPPPGVMKCDARSAGL